MSATAIPLAAWPPIQEAVREFRTDFTNLEQLVEGLFDEIERLSGELEKKAGELVLERERVSEHERQLAGQREDVARVADRFDRQGAQLGEILAELQHVKQQVAVQLHETHERASQAESLRELLESGTASANNDLVKRLSDLEHERNGLQRELVELRSRHGELTEALSKRDSETSQSLSGLEQERNALERELDAVRSRNAELTELAAQQKEELAERQAETAAELKRLGSLVEERFQRLSEPLRERGEDGRQDANAAEENPADGRKARDPVVNSVVAQLAKLQRNVSRR